MEMPEGYIRWTEDMDGHDFDGGYAAELMKEMAEALERIAEPRNHSISLNDNHKDGDNVNTALIPTWPYLEINAGRSLSNASQAKEVLEKFKEWK